MITLKGITKCKRLMKYKTIEKNHHINTASAGIVTYKTCQWLACETINNDVRHVDGVAFCSTHYPQKLREVVLDGLRFGISHSGECPQVEGWLNRFARYVTEVMSAPNGLTKRKIEVHGCRYEGTQWEVKFSMLRHPVGRLIDESYCVNLKNNTWEQIQTSVIKSAYAMNDGGEFLCPKCNELMRVTPGRAKCSMCDFCEEHEHTLFP